MTVVHPPVSTKKEIDTALAELTAHKDAWLKVGVAERIQMLDEIAHRLDAVAERWVLTTAEAKGYGAGHATEGDEWAMFAAVPRNIFRLKQVLTEVQKNGRPQLPAGFVQRNGQLTAQTFPILPLEKAVFAGYRTDLWFEPGVSEADALAGQAKIYRDVRQVGNVALILGAGNVTMLVPCDVTTKLFLENRVVLLKMNPVNDYLGPLIEEAYRPLIERGFLKLVYGGAKEGAYLCNHKSVDIVHMTGSDRTYDVIVFGAGEDGKKNKKVKKPRLKKPVTAELGGVAPLIIVPGAWTDEEIKEQARQLAFWVVVNAGFNCSSPRMIVTDKNWDLREKFMTAFEEALRLYPVRKAYYPNADKYHTEFLKAYKKAKLIGSAAEGELPWVLIPNLDAKKKKDIAFCSEAFCGLIGETSLDAKDTADFIAKAVKFSNETLWGNLTAYIIVADHADPNTKSALEQGIADLKYGTICVNMYAGLAYVFMSAPWGAYPGNAMEDIQSGNGSVNNLFLFEKIQKGVFRGPFHKQADNTLHTPSYVASTRAIARLFGKPTWMNFVRLILASMKK